MTKRCKVCKKKKLLRGFTTFGDWWTYTHDDCNQCRAKSQKRYEDMVDYRRRQPKADHTQQFWTPRTKGWRRRIKKLQKETRNFCTGRYVHQRKYGKELGAAIHKVSYLIKKRSKRK